MSLPSNSRRRILRTVAVAVAAVTTSAASVSAAGFEVVESDARIEIRDGGRVVFGWQREPLDEPDGGEQFAASAFVHPLTTPAGFALTCIQPADHRHHFGVWWPWKHLGIGGRTFNCWELQEGQGRQVAVAAEVSGKEADRVTLALENRHEIKVKDAYQPVIREKATMVFSRLDEQAYQLDIEIIQQPLGKVTVSAYRYSGFSWRGPEEWNHRNSRMRTSGGHSRGNANHQLARWVCVDGEAPLGRASLLLMSAAGFDGGDPERLRVWGPGDHDGAPFVNVNPVVNASRPLDHPAVARRHYRLVMADRSITSGEAERRWKRWQEEAQAGGED